jgi:hypothetical protein
LRTFNATTRFSNMTGKWHVRPADLQQTAAN